MSDATDKSYMFFLLIFHPYLDATDTDHWKKNVVQKAMQLVNIFLSDGIAALPSPALYSTLSSSTHDKLVELQKRNAKLQAIHTDSKQGEWRQHECTPCNKTLHGDLEWRIHLASKGHKKRTSRKRIYDDYLAKQQEHVSTEEP